jgi:hypothetical protein
MRLKKSLCRLDGVGRDKLWTLTFLGRNAFDCGRESGMSFRVNWPVLDLSTRRIFAKEVVVFPICREFDWLRNETTTAVRADISQNGVDTRRAKRALVGTNTGFK